MQPVGSSSLTRDQTWVPCIECEILVTGPPGSSLCPHSQHRAPKTLVISQVIGKCCCLVAQSSLTLCDPVNWSPPGSSVHGIFQARILDCHFLLQIEVLGASYSNI